jgi:hypothetical protein
VFPRHALPILGIWQGSYFVISNISHWTHQPDSDFLTHPLIRLTRKEKITNSPIKQPVNKKGLTCGKNINCKITSKESKHTRTQPKTMTTTTKTNDKSFQQQGRSKLPQKNGHLTTQTHHGLFSHSYSKRITRSQI